MVLHKLHEITTKEREEINKTNKTRKREKIRANKTLEGEKKGAYKMQHKSHQITTKNEKMTPPHRLPKPLPQIDLC
jgi:hypothetical protein